MKRETLNKRLEKLTKEENVYGTRILSKQSKAYQMIKDAINGTNKSWQVSGDVIRPTYNQSRTTQDHSAAVRAILNKIGVKHTFGNDAPRGGKTGNYIKVLTKITD